MSLQRLTAAEEAAYRDAAIYALTLDNRAIKERLGLDYDYEDQTEQMREFIHTAQKVVAAQVINDRRNAELAKTTEGWRHEQTKPKQDVPRIDARENDLEYQAYRKWRAALLNPTE